MKKILFFVNNWVTGGTEKMVGTLLENLGKQERNYKLVALRTMDDKRKQAWGGLPYPLGIETIELRQRGKGFRRLIGLIPGLIKVLRGEKPQLIFTHMPPTGTAVIALSRFLSRDTSRIVCVHHNRFLSSQYKNSPIKKILVSYFYKNVDLHVHVSDSLRKFNVKEWGLPAQKSITIYNPVDFDEINKLAKAPVPDDLSLFFDKPRITMVSRLSPQKDHQTLLRAFKKVISRRPSYLFLIGDGEERLGVEQLIQDLDLDDSVFLLGYKTNPYVYMAHSDIFVLSSHFEGLPTVVIEAMICGAPVIASDCEFGPREILEDGKYGVLVPVGSVEILAERIINLLEDRGLAKKYAESAHRKAMEFSKERIIPQYETVVDQLLKEETPN